MPEIHPQTIKIRRKRWTLFSHEQSGRNTFGECDPIDAKKKQISVKPNIIGVDAIDTLIHELLHAAMPDLAEDAIYETASDLAKVLWDLGYRGEWDE